MRAKTLFLLSFAFLFIRCEIIGKVGVCFGLRQKFDIHHVECSESGKHLRFVLSDLNYPEMKLDQLRELSSRMDVHVTSSEEYRDTLYTRTYVFSSFIGTPIMKVTHGSDGTVTEFLVD